MFCVSRVVLALLAVTSAVSDEYDKTRPVTKVIQILKDMREQLQRDHEEDEKIFQKLECWIKTNDREKTQAIKDAEVQIGELSTTIEEGTATSAKLNTQIKQLDVDIADNQKSLDQASALRDEQLAKFNEEEKDLLESIRALKSAVSVLSKHHASSFLQVNEARIEGIAASVVNVMQLNSKFLSGVLTKKDRDAIEAFAQEDPYARGSTFKKSSYSARSGEIFGILNQMLESFEKNLDSVRAEETQAAKAFEELKKAKQEEIQAAIDQRDANQEELAKTNDLVSESKVELGNTKKSLSADEQFLLEVQKKKQMTGVEWEQRQKDRTAEIAAVNKALEILSGDDAHALFSRTVSLVQVEASTNSGNREKAAKILREAGMKTENPRLSNLAMRVKLDAFTKVKKAIDDMVAGLQKNKDDEIKKRDYCIEQFHENDKEEVKKLDEHKDAKARIESLEQAIQDKQDKIDHLNKQLAEAEQQIKKASVQREEENKEYQKVTMDQRSAQKLLQGAINALQSYYGKNAPALAQESIGPAGFDKKKKNSNGGNVVGMLNTILDDVKTDEADGARAEKESQEAYDDFVKTTKAIVKAKTGERTDLQEAKGKDEADLSQTNEEKNSIEFDIDQNRNTKLELKEECDFLLKNFDLRQEKFADEIQALREAKSILSGSSEVRA